MLGETGIEKLKKIVREIGVWLDQESMHFEVAVGSEVEFLPTSEKEGHSHE